MSPEPEDPRNARGDKARARPSIPGAAGESAPGAEFTTQPQFSTPQPGSRHPGPFDAGAVPGPNAASPRFSADVDLKTPRATPSPGQGGCVAGDGKTLGDESETDPDTARRLIARFRAESERGRSPRIDDYLPDRGEDRTAVLVELLCVELECRLKAGKSVRLEDQLKRYPELGVERAADVVAHDYELRLGRGMPVSPEDYLGRFPQLAPALIRRFSVLVSSETDLAGSPTRPQTRPPRTVSIPGVRLPEKFEVIEKLGEGGMGQVWRVRRRDLGIDRAVKLINPQFALDAETRARMLREAQAMAQTSHSNVVIIHDVGTEPFPYIEMEYIPGLPLDKVLKPNVPMPLEWTARILDQLCDVLQVAHQHDIVHRDLKPSNLMLVEGTAPGRESLKILDFGIAKFLQDDREHLTTPGQTLGTMMYMSPEQVRNSAEVDGRSDLYTVGVILYELLTGCRPFTSRPPYILHEIVYTPAPKFRERNPQVQVPSGVEDLVLRCLEKDPAKRPATAAELAEEFHRLAFPPEVPHEDTRTSRPLLLAAAVLVLGLVGFLLARPLIWPAAIRIEPDPSHLEVNAGERGQVAILIQPDRIASRVKLRSTADLPTGIRVTETSKDTGKLRYFGVDTDPNFKPRQSPIRLEFLATDGRSSWKTSAELIVLPPNVAPLPPDWVAVKGADLVRVDGKTYPRKIERTVAGGTRVVALLIDKQHHSDPDPFYIMENKVWEGLFAIFARERPDEVKSYEIEMREEKARRKDSKSSKADDPRLPVRYVTAAEAQAFAEWLGGKGRGFLPTPEQWDQAAGMNLKDGRAGPFLAPWDPKSHDIAVGDLREPLPVGQAARDVSAFGCRDMSGNGLEWTRPTSTDAKEIVDLRAQSYTALSDKPFVFTYIDTKTHRTTESTSEITERSADTSFRIVIELAPGT